MILGFLNPVISTESFFFRCTHSQVVLSGSKVLLDFWIFLQHPYFTHTHTHTHTHRHTHHTHSQHTLHTHSPYFNHATQTSRSLLIFRIFSGAINPFPKAELQLTKLYAKRALESNYMPLAD